MRRFSSRNQLVTLNEINITPLLDLAFVLLIIFIITTPLLEQSINVKLPNGGSKESANINDTVTAEVSPKGVYYLKGRSVSSAAEMERLLVAEYHKNPKMVVRIRADADGAYRFPVGIISMCKRNGITRFDIATEPEKR